MEKKLPELKERFYNISNDLSLLCNEFTVAYDKWDININKNVDKLKEKMKEKIILGTDNGK